jgi:hypothetical protein
MANDWLPSSVEGRLTMAREWVEVLRQNFEDWDVQETEVDELRRRFTLAQLRVNENAPATSNSVTVAAARAAMDSLVEYMRRIRLERLHNSLIPPAGLAALGLRPRDTTPTPQPAPSTVPEIEAITAVIRELRFRLRDFGSKRWGKPAHVHGFEFVWMITESRPAHVSHLANMVTGTRNPVVLMFEEGERGKRVFFAARWVNNTLQPGPWSDIESAIIP